MNIDLLILSIEKNFQDLIGFSIHGPLGILIGMLSFSLLLLFLRHEKKDEKNFIFQAKDLSDIGDPIEANINLTRSLIEMDEFKKAKDCLDKLKIRLNLTQKQKDMVKILRQRLKEKENG